MSYMEVWELVLAGELTPAQADQILEREEKEYQSCYV